MTFELCEQWKADLQHYALPAFRKALQVAERRQQLAKLQCRNGMERRSACCEAVAAFDIDDTTPCRCGRTTVICCVTLWPSRSVAIVDVALTLPVHMG